VNAITQDIKVRLETGKYVSLKKEDIKDNCWKSFLHILRSADKVIFVEGNLDVISGSQANIKNIVCTSGKWISEAQMKLIQKFTNNVSIIPDLDAIKECYSNAEELLKFGFNVEVLKLDKKDLDEWLR